MTKNYDVENVIQRISKEGEYILISACRALPVLFAKNDPNCIKKIFVAHDPSGSALGIKASILSNLVDQIVCVSEAQKQLFLKEGALEGKITVINNGYDPEIFNSNEKDAVVDYRRIIFSGAIVPHKGLDLLLEAFLKIKIDLKDIQLDIFGSASMWGLEEYINLNQNIPGVNYFGKVDQRRIAEGFKRAGICVIPSRWFDSFPLTSIEAQACGTPILAFDVGGIGESIVPEKSGFLIKEVSVSSIEEKLRFLFQNPLILKEASKEALQFTKQRRWIDVGNSYLSIIKNSIHKNNENIDINLNRKLKPEDNRDQIRLGFITTWNQPCGLSQFASFLVDNLKLKNKYILAVDSPDADRTKDTDNIFRCWKRANEKTDTSTTYHELSKIIDEKNINLLHINCHFRFFKYPNFSEFLNTIRSKNIKVILHIHTVYTVEKI